MTRRAALASLLVLAAGCAGGAKNEDPAPGGVPAEAAAAPAAEQRTGEQLATEALDRGRALEKEGRRDAAEETYAAALKVDGVPTELRAKLLLRMSGTKAQAGKLEEALEYARGAQKLRPDWDDAAMVAKKLETKLHGNPDGDFAEAKRRKMKDAEGTDAAAQKSHAKGGGSIEDRLTRVENQLARMAEKWEAASRGGFGQGSKEHGAKDPAGAADADRQAMKEKLHRVHADFEEQKVAMKKHLAAAEEERATLKKRVQDLEAECAALRMENEKLRAGK